MNWICVAIAALVLLPGARGSVAVYVGKNLTEDGSALLAGYGDEPSSHWMVIAPRRQHPPGAKITVGGTGAARREVVRWPRPPRPPLRRGQAWPPCAGGNGRNGRRW